MRESLEEEPKRVPACGTRGVSFGGWPQDQVILGSEGKNYSGWDQGVPTPTLSLSPYVRNLQPTGYWLQAILEGRDLVIAGLGTEGKLMALANRE